jgi:hypothetical protein
LTDSGEQALTVDAEGRLTIESEDAIPSPQFMPSGEVIVDGETIGRMSPDGVFRIADGEELASIGVDGVTTVGELNLSFGPDGVVVGVNPNGPGVTLAPADSPAKRLAMTVLLMMTLGSDLSDEPANMGSDAGSEAAPALLD